MGRVGEGMTMDADNLELRTGVFPDSKWALPCLGFGSFLFIADDVNAPVLLPCDNDVSLASIAISFLLLALAVWWALRRDWDNRWNLPAIAVLTILISFYYVIVLFVPTEMQHPGVAIVLDIVFMIGRAGLSFFWMVAILPLGSRRVCYVLTASMLLFAFYCLLVVLFKDGAARVLLVLLPLMSACCLQAFYRMRGSFEISSPLKDDILVQSQEYLSLKSNYLVFVMGIVVPLICGSTVLAFVNKTWPGVSMEFFQLFSAQMGLLIGSVVMAFIQLILVRFFWTSTNFMFVSVLVPLALMVMLLIVVTEPSWVIVYFALLLLVEKSLIAFGVYSSYMFRIANNWMAPWCIAFLCIGFGGLLGELLLQLFSLENPLLFLIALATIYVASVCLASLYFGVKITQAYEGHLSGGFRGESSYSTAVRKLAESYDLTARECDILMELGRGRNAAYIAERLLISPQTAKTHQKNVYAKMGLHSQQDLIMLIDRTIEDAHLK